MGKIPFFLEVQRNGHSLCLNLPKLLRTEWKLHYLDKIMCEFDDDSKVLTSIKEKIEAPRIQDGSSKKEKSIFNPHLPLKQRLFEFFYKHRGKHHLPQIMKTMFPGEKRKSNEERLTAALNWLIDEGLVQCNDQETWFWFAGEVSLENLPLSTHAEMTEIDEALKEWSEQNGQKKG
jgi:antitoxin component of MazEF toxin-antitoxin module